MTYSTTEILKLQCLALQIAIDIEAKERKAPERYKAGTIVNGVNVGGQFKPKDKEVVPSAKPELRSPGSQIVASLQQGLEKIVELNPLHAVELAAIAFGKESQKVRQMIASRFRKNNPELADAIEQNPFKEIGADLKHLITGDQPRDSTVKKLIGDIGKAFEWAHSKYKETVKKMTESKDVHTATKMLGRAIAVAIPIALCAGAIIGAPAVAAAIGAGGIEEILISLGSGAVASYASDSLMDQAKIENPYVRYGVDILAMIASASVTKEFLKLSRMGVSPAEKRTMRKIVQEWDKLPVASA